MVARASPLQAVFLTPKESISKIDQITDKLKLVIQGTAGQNYLPLRVYLLGLLAQRKIIEYLNDDNLWCQVVWDSATGLPSHPSFAADLVKYTETFKTGDILEAILNSFSGWTLLQREESLCCCGGGERMVSREMMVNTVLKAGEDGLVIKLLVGVRSGDLKHLEHHFKIGKPSRVDGNLYIVFTSENQIRYNENSGLILEKINLDSDELFSVSAFEEIINRLSIAEF